MTLILSCLTPDFAIQVSDRRLTQLDGDVIEDEANKALLFCGHSSFAYTGLARIGHERADEWLMERIASAPSVFTGLEEAKRQATDRLRTWSPAGLRPSQRRRVRRIAFVGVAFLRHPAGGLHAVYLVLSNFFDGRGGWLQEADVTFDWWQRALGEARSEVFSAGVNLPAIQKTAVARSVSRAVDRDAGAMACVRLLVDATREVARQNTAVGPNVMCVILRREHLSPGDPSVASEPIPLDPTVPDIDRFRERPSPAGISWMYVPASTARLVHHGPVLACGDMMMKGMVFGRTDDLPNGRAEGSHL